VRITVGAIKGGVGKTTTAAYLALGLSRSGRTLLIDADPEQTSALAWSEAAGEDWPTSCTVIPWANRDLARRVADVAGDYDHLMIDTGPKNPLLLRQALTVTDELVIPVAPRPLDLRELGATIELASEVDTYSPLSLSVLLVQIRARTRAAVDARQVLDEMKLPVLAAEVRLREEISLSFGAVPADLGDYEAVLAELTTVEATP
jgi:chromosome partitioning protein